MKPVEKIASLTKYVQDHQARLTSPTPEKHKAHPEAHKAYLKLEIAKATKAIEQLKTKL
jgi:hypothetical protein